MQILVSVFRVIALLALATIPLQFGVGATFDQLDWLSLVSVTPYLVVAAMTLAISESICVVLDVVENTRRAADLLEVVAAERHGA